MAVTDADIVVYGATISPENDTDTQIGGAINTALELIFTDIDPAGLIEMLSDGADTRNLTVTYYTADGIKGTETKQLNGATPVAFAATMAAITKMVLSVGSASRTVTVRKASAGATLKVIAINIVTVKRIHCEALANASGGATKTFYEKFFFKNNSASALTGATISKPADPNNVEEFALEAALNGTGDNGVGNTRLVAPAGLTFDSTAKNVANAGTLSAGAAQGGWSKLTLAAGAVPADTSFTLRLSGIAA
jgi:hypothetical protein